MARKIKIISNGRAQGTRVVDAETGEDIGLLISKITWSIDARSQAAKATLEVEILQIEAEAEADEVIKNYLVPEVIK